MSYRLSPVAVIDLEAIVDTIGADNPAAASRWLTRAEELFELLGAQPELGAPRFDVRPGMRLFPVGRYLILYRAAAPGAEIVRVIHGARNWQSMV